MSRLPLLTITEKAALRIIYGEHTDEAFERIALGLSYSDRERWYIATRIIDEAIDSYVATITAQRRGGPL